MPPVDTHETPVKKFAFQTNVWRQLDPAIFSLSYSHRQVDDPAFCQLLESIRHGVCSDEMAAMLEGTVRRLHPRDEAIVFIFPHRKEAEQTNKQRIDRLDGELVRFEAIDTWKSTLTEQRAREMLNKQCRAPPVIELKVGAQVMLLRNLAVPNGLCNGTVGRVMAIQDGAVDFLASHGARTMVRPVSWEIKQHDRSIAERTQLPLVPAYAITSHVSQGQTITSRVVANLGATFTAGMAYVILSRLQRLDQLSLTSFSRAKIRAMPEALAFYREIEERQTIYL
jgi:ATP-dependent DNA helicase PIF1